MIEFAIVVANSVSHDGRNGDGLDEEKNHGQQHLAIQIQK